MQNSQLGIVPVEGSDIWGTGSKNLTLGRTIFSNFVADRTEKIYENIKKNHPVRIYDEHIPQLALPPTGTTPNCTPPRAKSPNSGTSLIKRDPKRPLNPE